MIRLMRNESLSARYWSILLGIGLLVLTACQGQFVMPTAAVPASLPGTADGSNLPSTWTPSPLDAEDNGANNFSEFPSPGPTPTPSETPIFPSRTPRPTHTPTATATGTATRYQSYIPKLPPSTELGPSKLGIHVIRNNSPDIMAFVRQAQPAVVKAVDDFGFLMEVKAASPDTITVGRYSTGRQDFTGSPEEEAQRFVEEQLDQYLANPAVDYWEGWNEPDPNLEKMGWYARFEQERVRLLASHGFRAAVGGFATGVPEMDEFALFLPAIETAKQHQGILTLHEYGAPDMTFLYGEPLPGYPAYSDRGALTFRYRWFYRDILEPAGLVIPLVISEAGIDGIIGNRPGPKGKGWSDFQDYWVEQGWGPNGVQAFINQLAWYDAGVRQDGYVIGFTIFTAGAFGYWENYDINPILPELADYVKSQGW